MRSALRSALVVDVVGLLSLAAVGAGVYLVFGRGWMLIVTGGFPLALYAWYLSHFLRRRRNP